MKQAYFSPLVLGVLLLTGCAGRSDQWGRHQKDFSAEKLKKQITQKNVENLIREWPQTAKQAAERMIDKYGLPDGMTENLLTWSDAGHFKRIFVHREEITHNFPVEHKDVLQQFVDYEIPAGKADDVLRYTGSILLDRTAGEMSARSDREEMNILSLNLADQILQGQMSPEQARQEYGKSAQALMEGEKTQYTSALAFNQPESSANPDEPIQMMQETRLQSEEESQTREGKSLGTTDEGVEMRMEPVPQSKRETHKIKPGDNKFTE